MEEKILNIFRKREGFLSGGELSRLLKVSRAAIWKHIEKLREQGYEIDAQPHLGYKLLSVPDRMLPEEITWQLGTKVIGKKVYSYEKTDSTMDIAQRLAGSPDSEGICIFAEEQTKGRGRLGRSWQSPKSKGIYLSVILKPDISPDEAPKITLLAAVAVANAIRQACSLTSLIKWPNDVLIDNLKVCGILTEMSAEVDRTKYIVVGIGLNANIKKSDLPRGATSLSNEFGSKISRVQIAKEILRQIDKLYSSFKEEGFDIVIKHWRDMSATLGCRVRVNYHNRKIEGQAMDVDTQGALVVRLDNGFVEHISAGDVSIIR